MLDATLLTRLPERLAVGGGTAIYLEGLCAADLDPASLRLQLGDLGSPVSVEQLGGADTGGAGGGRWATLLEIPAATPEGPAELRLTATVGGRTIGCELGELEIAASDLHFAPPSPSIVAAGDSPLIAVCMATHEPDPEHLARQLETIRAQDWPTWVCVISDDASSPARFAELQRLTADDERFLVSRSDSRLGFYRNFERALRMTPVEASFVALADQDDIWNSDKLSSLHATVNETGASLAYSDMRILDERGTLVSDTYWILRRNRWDDITSILVANTVTGAASLLRRELLEDALPFPPPIGEPYHDHWLALCAIAGGELAYLDRPTYDRVRHLGSVTADTGHARALRRMRDEGAGAGAAEGEGGAQPEADAAPSRRTPEQLYRESYLQLAQFARVAELRIGDRIRPARRRALLRFARADRTLSGPAWLAARSLRPLIGRNETLGRERALAAALIGRRLARRRARGSRPVRRPS